jgi:hypothetical protein
MSSLLDSLKEQISPDLIRGLASNSGEPSDSAQKALLTSGTAMLATLASKAQDSGFLNQIQRNGRSRGRRIFCRGGRAAGWHYFAEHALRQQHFEHSKQDRGIFWHTRLVSRKHPGVGRTIGARPARIEGEQPGT